MRQESQNEGVIPYIPQNNSVTASTADTWLHLFTQYRQHLTVRGLSACTLRNTSSGLNRWAEFVTDSGVGAPSAVTTKTITGFQHWLFHRQLPNGKARSLPSQNRVLSIAKGFLGYLHGEVGLLACNPAQALQLAREPDALPRHILTFQEAQRLVEAPNSSTSIGCRDRTLLEILYSTAIRRSELLDLTLTAPDLEQGLLRVDHGKGDKGRVVPLTRIACHYLKLYLRDARPALVRGWKSDKLFASRKKGCALSGWGLQELLHRYARAAKITKHVTPHLWRHTCATHLLQNNANLRCVQALLGHTSLATTERYLRLTVPDLKAMHRRQHPREQAFRAIKTAGAEMDSPARCAL